MSSKKHYTTLKYKRVGTQQQVLLSLIGNPKVAITEIIELCDADRRPITLFWVNSKGRLIKTRAGANGVFVDSNRHTKCGVATMSKMVVKVVVY